MKLNLIYTQNAAFALSFIGVHLFDIMLELIEVMHTEIGDAN